MSREFRYELWESFKRIFQVYLIFFAIGAVYALVIGPKLINEMAKHDDVALAVIPLFRHNFGTTMIELLVGSFLVIIVWFSSAANGFILGYIVTIASLRAPIGLVLSMILPHGIIELPALFLGLSLAHRYYYQTDGSWREYAINLKFLPLLVILFFCAAFIEARVTDQIAHYFYSSLVHLR